MKPTEPMKLEAYQLLLDASKNMKEAKGHFENILPLVHKSAVLSGNKKIESVADAIEKMISDVEDMGKDIDKHADKLNKDLTPEEAEEAETVPEEEEAAEKGEEGKEGTEGKEGEEGKEEAPMAAAGEGDTAAAAESANRSGKICSESLNGFGIPLLD